MSWIDIFREVAEERGKRAEELAMRLCGEGGALLLFGSRAREGGHPFSDWDLALIVRDGDYEVRSTGVGQLFVIPLDRLDELLATSMVILDILADGVLLCGDRALYEEALAKFKRYVEERGLVRSRLGWVPTGWDV